jgi:hypothetical protein
LASACNSTNNAICKECEAGWYSTGGAEKCQPCGDNEISNAAKSVCSLHSSPPQS